MHHHFHRYRALVALATLIGALPAAHAQAVHRCTDGARVYWSDRACPGNGAARITSFGPERTRENSRAGQTPKLQKAPEHQVYLGVECAQINDAIRTARARGVGHDTQQELRDEYRRKCSEEDSEARKQLRANENERRTAAREARAQEQKQRAQSTMTREQCMEMGRIAAERRKRLASMTEGERGDFERFQANFTERCKGV